MIISHKSPDKSRRVNEVRAATLAAGFTWGGNTFDIDDKSQALITGRALKLLLNPPHPDIVWRSKDNQNIAFTRDQFLAFAQAVDAHVDQIFRSSWAQKDP